MTRCPLSPVIFNLCFDYVIIGCKDNDFLQTNILTTILFADEQVMVNVTEDSLKKNYCMSYLKLPQHIISIAIQLKQKY
jgi:hypothetical protein